MIDFYVVVYLEVYELTEEIEPIVPLLPLRGMLVFPTMVLHLDVGREQSVQALEQAMLTDHLIFLTTQKDVSVDNADARRFI